MNWRNGTCSLLALALFIVWALLAGAANADQKDQTQGQKDAHLFACHQAYYACAGKCSQAVSIPLIQACTDGCESRYSACKAEAPASSGPLKKQLPK